MNRSKPVVFTQLFEFQSILVITIYKVFGQKFSLYREGSRLFRINFVPSFSEGQNIILKGVNLRDREKI